MYDGMLTTIWQVSEIPFPFNCLFLYFLDWKLSGVLPSNSLAVSYDIKSFLLHPSTTFFILVVVIFNPRIVTLSSFIVSIFLLRSLNCFHIFSFNSLNFYFFFLSIVHAFLFLYTSILFFLLLLLWKTRHFGEYCSHTGLCFIFLTMLGLLSVTA